MRGSIWSIDLDTGGVACQVERYVAIRLHSEYVELRKTSEFARWLDDLRDLRARARIQIRIQRLMVGNPGNVKPVAEGVSELRIDYGPGYRVYYTQHRGVWVLLLCGGR